MAEYFEKVSIRDPASGPRVVNGHPGVSNRHTVDHLNADNYTAMVRLILTGKNPFVALIRFTMSIAWDDYWMTFSKVAALRGPFNTDVSISCKSIILRRKPVAKIIALQAGIRGDYEVRK
ncbi:hypothetical protein A0H81_12172 [Grifola frondosa]|uniref:Uncharacterized protein n=1 Tax=Grifola frondosa TaxID=5627 RepID=A0A1C7LSS1_GRIFR|nr:hypothetical protein A0H81_12172 [Grifola frondosa]